MIDAKLKAILQARGQWNDDGVSRSAKGRVCRSCGRSVMVGLDADVGAFAVTCDPQPLTPLGEVTALFAGLSTYSLTWAANHYEIDHRDASRIAGSPAGTSKEFDTIAQHKCSVIFEGNQAAESRTIREKGSSNYDQCPY